MSLKAPSPPPPQAPTPPALPPMFGDTTQPAGRKIRSQAGGAQREFGSFLGTGSNPTNTGQRTLLGA